MPGEEKKFRNMTTKLIQFDNNIQNIKKAIEEVKNAELDDGECMEDVLHAKLAVMKSNEPNFQQHEKLQQLNERIFRALHPGITITHILKLLSPKMTMLGTCEDDDIEMTQEINTKCPYTGMDMVHPVRNKLCGHNYEREGIMQYIKQRMNKAKCPLSGCGNEKPVEESDLVENKELKRYIEKNKKSK
ncbi:E3 SUMO-protein ligase NSE2-like [Mya arenaria]|uniref:E3 SUMO-protein ligase NSE2-like n=1 Tax=Mya arenaria TaxID=6604 RepID=UPI0022DFDBB3|nr:E3 SUMO-protein ligase NSE2-like [Mya arenaria]